MTLRDLEYFTAIAREHSITRAAASLYVAQPALSQCLQKIEKETGVELVVRSSSSGVVLTSEGQCFLEFAERVLQERTELDKKLQDVENAENGEIRLGFTGTQATFVLPYILPEFQAKHPGITITLVEANSPDIEEKLLRHEVDIGILHPPILHKELDCYEISTDDMVIIPRTVSPYQDFVYYKEGCDEPYLSLDFFREEPIVLTLPEQRSRMVCDQIFANAGIVPKVRQLCRSIVTLNALAQVDYTSVISPRKQLSTALRNRGYYRIDESVAVPYTFVVATLKNSYHSIAVRHLRAEFERKQYTF